jgi:hypothetical protein
VEDLYSSLNDETYYLIFIHARVNPKYPYYNAHFKGAKFIRTEDLDLDNTIIFRAKVEKPGWTKRWNTKPDLDVSGGPFT